MLLNPVYNHIFHECNSILNNTADSALKAKKRKLRDSCLELYRSGNYELQEFYGVVHEIRLYDYLKNLGMDIVARDDTQAGPDFCGSIGYIECVSATKGKTGTPERAFLDSKLNGQKNRYLSALPRLSSVIKDKRDKYLKYQDKKIIDIHKPQIIALNTSVFSNEFHSSLIIDLLYRILSGIGCEVWHFDEKHNLIREAGVASHCYDDKGKKSDDKSLEFSYFYKKEYKSISAILLTNNAITERLDKNYVHLFLNPLSDIPLDIKTIQGIRCFALDSITDKYLNFKWSG